ncbi:MAG: FecR domain-containing protein, partial [Polyangia bacterium]|nr:FecR domain-containing protein [Polyangia bacterium]
MSKTSCQRLQALIQTDPEQGRHLPSDLEEHVKGCAACQVELRAATRLLGLLEGVAGDLEPKASPAEVARRAMAPAPKKAASQPEPRRGRLWLWIPATAAAAVAATLLLLFGLGHLGSHAPGGGPGDGTGGGPGAAAKKGPLVATACERFRAGQAASQPCALGQDFEAGKGERLRIALGDGSTLWVNHQTRLRLLPEERRALRLEAGQIFLDVTRQGSLPPLGVRLPTGEVRVVGTQLQVLARKDLAVIDVLRGKVIARSGGRDEPVEAGREAILYKEAAPVVRAAADLGGATEWADAKLRVAEGTSGFGSLSAKRPGQKDETEQALRLTDHRVTVRIQGSLARTEIEEAFHNDSGHTLEGIYKFPMPPEARIAGLDLLVDGKWEHGAVVERQRGEKIWAGVIRNATPKKRRPVEQVEYIWVPGPWRDPALLKWKQGSEFELRIFPIPGKGERRVRIAYTETLAPIPGGRRYVLPLAADPAGRPRAERFALEARVAGMPADLAVRTAPYDLQTSSEGGAVSLRMERAQFAPTGDLVIDVPEANLDRELRAFAYRDSAGAGEGYALLALRPDIPMERRADSLRVLFLVDRSYSTQKLRLERAADLVGRVVRALGKGAQVQVLACATTCEALSASFREAGEETAADLEGRLRRMEPLGSTRLRHALAEAGKALSEAATPAGSARVIYLGDGIPTVGETEPARLATLAKTLLGGARLTTVSLGGQV